MADIESSERRPKRRLKVTSETVRQRQQNASAKTVHTKSRLRRMLSPLGWPFRKIYGLSIWQTTAWKPFKFVGHYVGLILAPPYVRSSFKELRLVTWPNWKQSWRLTFAVLGFSIVFGIAIAGIDFVLDKLFREVLLK